MALACTPACFGDSPCLAVGQPGHCCSCAHCCCSVSCGFSGREQPGTPLPPPLVECLPLRLFAMLVQQVLEEEVKHHPCPHATHPHISTLGRSQMPLRGSRAAYSTCGGPRRFDARVCNRCCQPTRHLTHTSATTYNSTGNISSCFFFIWRGLINVCSYSFWRRSNYF